jgi:hypothetical protein
MEKDARANKDGVQRMQEPIGMGSEDEEPIRIELRGYICQ